MLPPWIRKNSDRHLAFKETLEKCGVDEKTATIVLNECFKGFQEAFSRPSMPEIHMGIIMYRPNTFKMRLRMLKYGTWLRNGLINKLYYIFLTLPIRIKSKFLLGNKKLKPVERKDEALFMHRHYDRIMTEWLSDIKQYAENNNMPMEILRNSEAYREADDEFWEYKTKIIKQGNFLKKWKKEKRKKLITNS